jgi:hypothetical protein
VYEQRTALNVNIALASKHQTNTAPFCPANTVLLLDKSIRAYIESSELHALVEVQRGMTQESERERERERAVAAAAAISQSTKRTLFASVAS